MGHPSALSVLLVGALALPAAAQEYYQQQPPQAVEVQQYGYVGVHPLPYDVGAGFCYEQGAHFHEYPPFDQHMFRESGGYFYFVGDPVDFGYQQQTWGYRANHPVPVAYGGGYCYIEWPHQHHYPPPADWQFNLVGGYYAYYGAWDPFYYQNRSYYIGYYGGYYRDNYWGNRYYSVRPPAVYRSSLVVGAPGVYRSGMSVAAPGGGRVTVGAPMGARAYAPGVRVGAPGGYQNGYQSGVRVGAPGGYQNGYQQSGGAVRVAPPGGYQNGYQQSGGAVRVAPPGGGYQPAPYRQVAPPAPSYRAPAPAPMRSAPPPAMRRR